jgi:MBG domain (YGX type)
VISNATLTVRVAPLTVRADDKARLYGTDNPTLTGTITGLQNGDDIRATYSTTATRSSDTGNYPITPVINDAASRLGNYQLTVQNGTLTVSLLPGVLGEPQPPLEVRANDNTRTYGSANPGLSGSITGLQSGDNISATYVTTANNASAAGGYAIRPVLHDPDNKLRNYKLTVRDGVLMVGVAALDVRADDKARGYGGANPPLTGTISGLQNGDPISATYTTAASPASPIGSYVITPTLSDPAGRQSNYAVTMRHGLLSVKAAGSVRIVSINTPDGRCHISGSGDANFSYHIETSVDLIHWNDLGAVRANSSGVFEFDESTPLGPGSRFFRVHLP